MLLQPGNAAFHRASAAGAAALVLPAPAGTLLPRPPGPPVAPLGAPGRVSVLAALSAMGVLPAHGHAVLLSDLARGAQHLPDLLLARGLCTAERLYPALGTIWGLETVDPLALPPDPRLIDRLGPGPCLREGILPWRDVGGATVILTAYPEEFTRHRAGLEAVFGPLRLALAPYGAIEASLHALRGPRLLREAETRVAAAESCRTWSAGRRRALGAAAFLLAGLALAYPVPAFLAALALAYAGLVPVTALKLMALIASLRHPAPVRDAAPVVARRPVVTLIVALYQESDIAGRLVRRLGRLDYPQDRLDILLAVEEDDRITREALARATLPPAMRIIVVPRGRVRTKPRALNFALAHARGTIIGVYDAEDAPEPGQISRVVQRFHERDARVACLQGALDFYNPTTNWLSRCFTLEYAAWFRVVLPGLARLGLPVPLGGTTLFFRREALEALGGWDAHNVTEDADLGLRLARHGYRTELIETTTHEEANCHALPWIRQRSRWIKGYMMTWGVHMRQPRLTLRQLGWRGFLGFQVLFLGSLSQALLAPVLWAGWLLALGLPHPATGVLSNGVILAIAVLGLLCEALGMAVLWLGLRRSGQRLSPLWIPTLSLYFPLAAFASWKALWEMVARPFYWDKTRHGHIRLGFRRGLGGG